ncbi:uncharacterized protein LOC106129438 [Amyelois transitella]|uniref:uncharacterized protein LOC106129438 n=1 Tax=Amyelois transitella TaxID=680683 RepID=UPI0029901F81|nr:uncharacterized protein LOC106129438 [Amyelois transitella]
MKKVRFQACDIPNMNDSECHSPRPFLETKVENTPACYEYSKPLAFCTDPLRRFETSNCVPYPLVNPTNLDNSITPVSKWSPSSDLELSMLDATCHEPRTPPTTPMIFQPALPISSVNTEKELSQQDDILQKSYPKVLTTIENRSTNEQTNKMNSDNSFFITKGNLNSFKMKNFNTLQQQFQRLSLDKENNPVSKKTDMIKMGKQVITHTDNKIPILFNSRNNVNDCSCHHCVRVVQTCNLQRNVGYVENSSTSHLCKCTRPILASCSCDQCIPSHQANQHIHSHCIPSSCHDSTPKNTIDKKTLAIEKYEKSNNSNCTNVQKQSGIKEKREPTVADLFKIIKLQNEQLQLLQEKVDKFISSSNPTSSIPIQSYTTEHVALETNREHKISIGVMTSFEMVRTSTVINKEVVQQTENSQIQCNKSQLSIKEIVSKNPVNLNFLDGIAPVGNNLKNKIINGNYEEKTLNEMSLYNIQVDNATTPLMSPEQTLYLDVRDYSESDPGSDDQSNIGWTYYNKVMTHVNGMLQDSDMPSSASALYRNTRQQCLQMQIDKTNLSVTKRVKFGDDPLGIHQPHIYTATTDTSMKMNQLAAKYLKGASAPSPAPAPQPVAAKTSVPNDMSFATRNYMERHKLLQGVSGFPKEPPTEIPRFLDITALKQQPKLL